MCIFWYIKVVLITLFCRLTKSEQFFSQFTIIYTNKLKLDLVHEIGYLIFIKQYSHCFDTSFGKACVSSLPSNVKELEDCAILRFSVKYIIHSITIIKVVLITLFCRLTKSEQFFSQFTIIYTNKLKLDLVHEIGYLIFIKQYSHCFDTSFGKACVSSLPSNVKELEDCAILRFSVKYIIHSITII